MFGIYSPESMAATVASANPHLPTTLLSTETMTQISREILLKPCR